jgi:uncharacterized integral membrane protein
MKVASAALVILGIILVVLGLFAGNANLPIIIVGLAAILAGGVLQVFTTRRA